MQQTDADPAAILRRMAGGFLIVQFLSAAAKLGLADHLAEGPRTAADLADKVGGDAKALHRFMRMLVVLDILAERDQDLFVLTPLGELLRASHPDNFRGRVLYLTEINYPAAQGLLHSVKTGEAAFDHVFGMPLFSYLSQRPSTGALFNQLMGQITRSRAADIIRAYDFTHAGRIVDIGGGDGTLLRAILRAYPKAKGTLFEQPGAASWDRVDIFEGEIRERIELKSGDFFSDPLPKGADLYLLSNVLHDWTDERAIIILQNCRRATTSKSRLLVIEEILPSRVSDGRQTIANDLSMLLLTGGRERTESEFQTILTAGGFQIAARLALGEAASDREQRCAIFECAPRL